MACTRLTGLTRPWVAVWVDRCLLAALRPESWLLGLRGRTLVGPGGDVSTVQPWDTLLARHGSRGVHRPVQARFALKHHGVEYKTTPYLPVLGDLMLRWRLGQWSGRVTVPVLFLDLSE